jgi:murein DD-endopeptidase MepM/ murein hydrolase activator NlpD
METVGQRLLRAQELALRADTRIDRLNLDALNRRIPDIDVAEAITQAQIILVIEGAASLELDIYDPDLALEGSGALGPNEHGHLRDIRVTVDGLGYRLTAIRRSDETLHLTLEDEAVQRLRRPTKPLTASRGSKTRGQFIEMLVKDVAGNSRLALIPFESPEKSVRQPVAAPDIPDTSDKDTADTGSGGFDRGAKITVKGLPADAEQKRNIRIALRVADEENAGPKATLALIVAGIGESSFRRKSTQPRTKAHGVFQLIPATADSLGLDPEDTEATARHFLRNGYYKYGGAIKLARENASMSVGEIVSKVEGSDAGGGFYQAYAAEARDIVTAWNPGARNNSSSDRVLISKQYQFTRGTNGERESSWDAALRLAEEVRWRFFVAAGVAAFYSDDRLLANPASIVIERDDPGVLGFTWDMDHGKLASNVEIRAIANRWSAAPGAVVVLRDFGLATGRWLTERVEQDVLSNETTLTLYKPLSPRKEPAHEIHEGDQPKHTPSGAKPRTTSTGLTYPLSTHGTKGGGPEDHAKRAFGNWQSDNAIDILVAQGTEVLAVDDAEIVKLGGAWRGGKGNPDGFNVTLKTDDNEWFYTHLRYRSPKLKVGGRVRAGDHLGGSGAANAVNHLHIACKTGNPVELLGV